MELQSFDDPRYTTMTRPSPLRSVYNDYVTIELHLLTDYEHTGDMRVVYLPKEKILAGRLNLDVETIAPFHGAKTTTVAELAKSAGKI